MRTVLRLLTIVALLFPLYSLSQDKGAAYLLKIDGAIGPATSSYIEGGIKKAQAEGGQLIILQMDTPGGLDTSMRKINKAILSSTIPVVGFVAPEGARAASAGTYILYACHIAVMAPATNLGAATPIQIGGGMPDLGDKEDKKEKKKKEEEAPKNAAIKKAVSDARAYIRGLAQRRGRNVKWAEKAVEKADSLSAKEALQMNVINLIADNNQDLLEKLNDYKVEVLGQERTLKTTGIEILPLEPGWKYKLLNTISNPNIAYILLMIGIYGLIFEFMNPGFVVPGVVGAICLLLGLYALHVLPINFTGVALLILGIALMITEAFVPSFGALGVGGVISFVIGSLMIIDTEKMPGLSISKTLIGTVALISAGFFLFIVGMAIKARRRKIVSGSEEMIGAIGEAQEDFQEEGNIFIHSENWEARTKIPLKKGDCVKVIGRDGLILLVEPITPKRIEED